MHRQLRHNNRGDGGETIRVPSPQQQQEIRRWRRDSAVARELRL